MVRFRSLLVRKILPPRVLGKEKEKEDTPPQQYDIQPVLGSTSTQTHLIHSTASPQLHTQPIMKSTGTQTKEVETHETEKCPRATLLSNKTATTSPFQSLPTLQSALENLKYDLTCPMCRSLYNTPVLMLKCMHRYCSGCWHKYAETAPKYHREGGTMKLVRCPLCQEVAPAVNPGRQFCCGDWLARDWKVESLVGELRKIMGE